MSTDRGSTKASFANGAAFAKEVRDYGARDLLIVELADEKEYKRVMKRPKTACTGIIRDKVAAPKSSGYSMRVLDRRVIVFDACKAKKLVGTQGTYLVNSHYGVAVPANGIIGISLIQGKAPQW